MADQKTKGDGTQGKHNYGVLPMNMGKSLKFGDKVYDVNVGQTLQVTENGLVEVKLSQTAGNLLQQHDDGLYYGIQAPVNVSNLFVDAVNGVDQDPNVVKGAGTREKPLKTIAYAISLIPEGTNSSRIRLHEGQEHNFFASEITTELRRKSYTVVSYGQNVDHWTAYTNPDNWNQWRVFDLSAKATINFIIDEKSKNVRNTLIVNFCQNNLVFGGIILNVVNEVGSDFTTSTAQGVFGDRDAFGEEGLSFIGCIIKTAPHIPLVYTGKTLATIRLDSTWIDTSAGGNLLRSDRITWYRLRHDQNPNGWRGKDVFEAVISTNDTGTLPVGNYFEYIPQNRSATLGAMVDGPLVKIESNYPLTN